MTSSHPTYLDPSSSSPPSLPLDPSHSSALQGNAFDEAKAINQSLTTLGRCIEILASGSFTPDFSPTLCYSFHPPSRRTAICTSIPSPLTLCPSSPPSQAFDISPFLESSSLPRSLMTLIPVSSPLLPSQPTPQPTLPPSLPAAGKKERPPFRESKLTRLLSNAIGGGAKTTLIVCVAPTVSDQFETVNSLEFGLQAMNVVVKAKVNASTDYNSLTASLMSQRDKKLQPLRQLECKVTTDATTAKF